MLWYNNFFKVLKLFVIVRVRTPDFFQTKLGQHLLYNFTKSQPKKVKYIHKPREKYFGLPLLLLCYSAAIKTKKGTKVEKEGNLFSFSSGNCSSCFCRTPRDLIVTAAPKKSHQDIKISGNSNYTIQALLQGPES